MNQEITFESLLADYTAISEAQWEQYCQATDSLTRRLGIFLDEDTDLKSKLNGLTAAQLLQLIHILVDLQVFTERQLAHLLKRMAEMPPK